MVVVLVGGIDGMKETEEGMIEIGGEMMTGIGDMTMIEEMAKEETERREEEEKMK